MIKLLVILATISSFFGGCSYINRKFHLKDDNVIEEVVEDIIEKKTGLDFDLTPGSAE